MTVSRHVIKFDHVMFVEHMVTFLDSGSTYETS